MELKVLFIEDDEKLSSNLKEYFDGAEYDGNKIVASNATRFDDGIANIKSHDFDLVVLDLFKDYEAKDEDAGVKVLEQIRSYAFIPVIFYTGHPHKVKDLRSAIVGIVSKGEGFDGLTNEIKRIIATKLAFIKTQSYSHLRESLREYFWEVVDKDKQTFATFADEISLGYLLLRRFANSLTKEKIREILGDDRLTEKVHPMEFYIYPAGIEEYEAGDILRKGGRDYVILTPSCDFVQTPKRPRRVGKVLLVVATPLKEMPEYLEFNRSKNRENTQKLIKLIEARKSDQYFFLSKAPFIDNLVLDFQNKTMVPYDDLSTFEKVAKLDAPFAQSMIASFVRFYNRIGFPDIDSEYVIANI